LTQNLCSKRLNQESGAFVADFGSEKENKSVLRSSTVSIIIPAYNEEKNVDKVISETIAVMNLLNLPYEIILVDDGSTDKTGLIASFFKIKVLINKQNRGKGYSLKKALRPAHGDIIINQLLQPNSIK
jgi:cellulose synthase/poly-beta-1,6-N-acetylglucosamine synthase-like glycosyltransferase